VSHGAALSDPGDTLVDRGRALSAATAARPQPAAPSSDRLPGPRSPGWWQTAHFLARPTAFFEHHGRRHGDMFFVRLQGLATGKMVVVSEPALIEEVFKGDPDDLRAGEAARTTIEPIGGPNSLLVLDAPKHLEDRRLMLPPFHGERMRSYADIMAEETERSLASWPVDTPFPLRPRMADITLDVIMRAVFGLERDDRYHELRRALVAMVANDRAVSTALMVPALRRDAGPWRGWQAFQTAIARADALIYDEIARRRTAPDLDAREDILSMLLVARRRDGTAMTDRELRDELVTMLLAGHETTATGLAWTFELLFRHPEAMARLRSELATGDDAYLDAVVYEALRVRPVIPFVVRVLKRPMELGGHLLPAGVTVVPAIHLVHRRPDLYPEPAAFRPERFLGRKPGTYEWLPFGGGMRRCLGASFAQFEMAVVVRRILAQAELAPASPRPERIKRRAFTLVPDRGAPAILRLTRP
jgi:cytochrome P450 family 135